MPRIDAAMQSGKIVEWLKKPDEKVMKGEGIVLVEGEKTTFEVEAPCSGVILKLLWEIGADVPVGQIVALIGGSDEVIREGLASTTPTVLGETQKTASSSISEGAAVPEIGVSPAARKLAREHEIDLKEVKGTGPRGRILPEDIRNAIDSSVIRTKLGTHAKIKEVIPLEGRRKAVAERLSYSFHTTVPAMIATEVDMEALEEARLQVSLSVTPFVLKAVAKALRHHLILNSSLDATGITIYDDINIAVGIETPDGLTAPVVVGCEQLNLGAISQRVAELRELAVTGKLSIYELTGGTFTVTNLGGEGVELFAPIINPPQTAILAIGQVAKRPTVVRDSVAIHSRATMSLIFDHRVTDGVPAAKFLKELKLLLENPDSLTK